jgi:hypothetical protein
LAAFDHLFPPESDGPSESQLGDEKQLAKQSLPLKKLDSSRYRGGINIELLKDQEMRDTITA